MPTSALRSLVVFAILIGIAGVASCDRNASDASVASTKSQAEKIVGALAAYKHANRRYPAKLDDLVPKYLNSIEQPRLGDDGFTQHHRTATATTSASDRVEAIPDCSIGRSRKARGGWTTESSDAAAGCTTRRSRTAAGWYTLLAGAGAPPRPLIGNVIAVMTMPPFATSRRRKVLVVWSLALVAIAYLSGPIIAGIFGVGNRTGPKIYKVGLHEMLYLIAWEASSHEGKPRLPAVFRSEYRPSFYGQYSRNDDPVWVEAECKKWRERHAAARRRNNHAPR